MNGLKFIGAAEQIRSVANRWRQQYPGSPHPLSGGRDAEDIYHQLLHLGSDATPADVASVIGNDMWIGEICTLCRQHSNDVFQIGDEPDYESHTVYVCVSCARQLSDEIGKLIDAGKAER